MAGSRVLSVLCSRAANVDRFGARAKFPPGTKRKKREKTIKAASSLFDAETRLRQKAFKVRTVAWAGVLSAVAQRACS